MAGMIPLKNYQISRQQTMTASNNSETKKSYDIMYEDIASRANEVSPNDAKARIVKNTPVKFFTTPIKDTYKDAKNFSKAASTGRISDNNLGRLNDFGLKIGALTIAGFLAAHSKTTTSAVMQFVGGGAFIASMSLWPKLFINLPARLIHGFPIDQKYISAQGDKKDFYLDNQFIPWDAMKEEDKRKYAKKADIDYDSKNGKEKIERKMQKTALQNRTLGLLTASLGVPLMTSLSCNRIQPLIYNQVVKHNYENAKNAISSKMESFFSLLKAEPKNQVEIHNLFENYQTKELDDAFFKKLSELLKLDDIFSDFKDQDDLVAISKYNPYHLEETLKDLQRCNGIVSVDEIIEGIKAVPKAEISTDVIEELKESLKGMTVEQASIEIRTKLGSQLTYKQINGILDNLKRTDNKNFFEYIEYYNKDVLGQTRARLKAFLKTMNSVVGSKAESVYTKEYSDVMNELFDAFKLPYSSKNPDVVSLKSIAKSASDEDCVGLLSSLFRKKVEGIKYGSEEYGKLISQFTFRTKDRKLADLVKKLQSDNNLNAIIAKPKAVDNINGNFATLSDAIMGGKMGQANILDLIKNFVRRKEIDLDSTKTHAIICANFETRLANGSFERALREKGLLTEFTFKETGKTHIPLSLEQLEEAAKGMIYDGSFSREVNGGALLSNDTVFKSLYEILYSEDAYSYECKNIKGFGESLAALRNEVKDFLEGGNPKNSSSRAASFAFKMTDHAKKLYNDKTWMRIFLPMAIILAVSTLLIQPLFGNIKKEFPDEQNKEGGKK